MPKNVAISPVVRAILTENIDLNADAVIQEARRRGVTASVDSIRTLTHNIKSDLKKKGVKAAPAAARTTSVSTQKPASVASAAPDLAGVFANVTLVNKVVDVAGGIDNARQVAEAVKACGSVDAFLKHLDLVAGIRT